MTPPDRRAHDSFADLCARNAAKVRSYARRRVGDAGADDVATETFLIAWRKLDRMPESPLPWLLGIARRVSSNQQRAAIRRNRLSERIAIHEPPPGGDPAMTGDGELLGALARCFASRRHRWQAFRDLCVTRCALGLVVGMRGMPATSTVRPTGC